MLLAARYVLPVTQPHIEDGAVLVRHGVIEAVGSRGELQAQNPDEEVRDFGLAALMPGFVDVHTHLEYSVFRGLVNDLPYTQWKLQVLETESVLTSEDWDDSARLGALEALRSGITSVADITDTGASLRAVADAGLRGIVYREVQTMEKNRVRDLMARAFDDVARWREGSDPSLVRIGLAPHAPYSCHPDVFGSVAEEAVRAGLPIATHLAGSKDEYNFIKYGSSPLMDFPDLLESGVGWLPTGVSPVRYLLQWGFFSAPEVLGVHCVQVDEEDIRVLAAHDVAVAYCPRCNAKLAMGVAPVHAFSDFGLRLGLGTDSPASNATMDYFDEMRVGLLIQRSVAGEASFYTAERYIRMATVGSAQALGMGESVGSLESGKRADVIAVDLSHSHQIPTTDPAGALVHTANQDNVLMTMIDGKVVYERGEWATLDAERIMERAAAVRARLRA